MKEVRKKRIFNVDNTAIIINKVTEKGMKEVRKKRIFNVDNTGIEMFWHPNGDGLAVRVSHYESLKKFKREEENKTMYHDLELVLLNARQSPVVNVALDGAEAG